MNNNKRQYLILCLSILFWSCSEKSPLEIEHHVLDSPDSPPIIEESILMNGDDFSVGYYNGNIRSDQVSLVWDASEDENFLAYKIFRAYGSDPASQGIFEGFESASLSGWNEYGDCGGWNVTNNYSYDGSYSIQSNSDADCIDSINYLEKTIAVPQNEYIFISFYTNGETPYGGYGAGELRINNIYIDYWSNINYWQNQSYTYYTGSNTEISLEWRWYSDYYSFGLLDNIEISIAGDSNVAYSLIKTLNDKNKFTFLDTMLTQNQYYTYKVATIVEQGTHTVDNIHIKTPLWEVPSNIQYEILSPEVVEVNWKDNSESESSFIVYLEKLEQTDWDWFPEYEPIGWQSSSQDDTSMVFSGLSTDIEYRFGVKAKNSWEETDTTYSNIFTILFNPPTSLNASLTGTEEVVYLSWDDNSTLENGVEIFRRIEPNFNYESIGFSNEDENYFYDFISIEDFKFDSSYAYSVRAFNNYADTIYTDFSNPEYISFTLDPPNSFSANQQVGSKLVDLIWYDNSLLESGFEIERDTGNGFELLTTVSANTTNYTDTDTTSFEYGSTYTYRIRAYNDYSQVVYTDYSTEESVTLLELQFLNEGFEGGVLPYGWSQWTSGGNGCSISSQSVYGGNYSIYCGGGYYDTEYLEVTIDVPQYTYVDISFYQNENDISGDGDLYIDNIPLYDWDNGYGWSYRSTTAYTGANSQITLRWTYNTLVYGNFYLDNIQVTW